MSDTYEINEFDEVVPYTSGRRCLDTRAWRDATELELQQRNEIAEIERENELLRAANSDVKRIAEERDAMERELHQCQKDRQREHEIRCRLAGELETLRAWIKEADAMLCKAACIVIDEAVERLGEIEGVRALVETCPLDLSEAPHSEKESE